MKNSTTRRLAALGLGVALVVSGCASDNEADAPTASEPTASATTGAAPVDPADLEALKGIKLSGEPGSAPVLEFETPFAVTAPAALVVDEGEGAEIKDGDTISIQSVTYSGETGEAVEGSDTFANPPEALPLDSQVVPILIETVVGQKVGTRFVFASPPVDGPGSYILAVEIMDTKETPKPLERATGETVEPAKGLPKVTLDDAGKPSIDIPKDYSAPDELVVQPLITGEGATVTEDQTVTAHYTGWTLDGESFDSSWERGEPSSFPLQGVVAGWTQGLSGQTVGSQVLLVIPPELGYGGTKGHALEKETLVFVVDILAAY